MNISELSDDVIVAEAIKRFPGLSSELDLALVLKQENEKPKLLEDSSVNIDMLQAACENYFESVFERAEGELENLKQYVFEEAMIACYGNTIFQYINRMT